MTECAKNVYICNIKYLKLFQNYSLWLELQLVIILSINWLMILFSKCQKIVKNVCYLLKLASSNS